MAGRKAGRKSAPKNETPEDKFVRLGNARMNKAIKALRQIGQLGSRTYKGTASQKAKMETTLKDELTMAIDKLNAVAVETQDSFKL